MFTSQEDDTTRICFLTRSHCGLMGLLGGQACVRWCRQHAHWNLNIRQLNHRVKVWKRCGERYADSCNSGGIAVISTFMFLSQDCNIEKSHLNAMIHKSFARVSNMFQVFCLLCISIKSIFQSSHNLTVTNEVWLLCSCERHLSHVSGWVCDSA